MPLFHMRGTQVAEAEEVRASQVKLHSVRVYTKPTAFGHRVFI